MALHLSFDKRRKQAKKKPFVALHLSFDKRRKQAKKAHLFFAKRKGESKRNESWCSTFLSVKKEESRLSRLQHIFDKNAVPFGGITNQNVGVWMIPTKAPSDEGAVSRTG